MDQQQNNQTPEPRSQVMDIQPPQPAPVAQQPVSASPEVASVPAGNEVNQSAPAANNPLAINQPPAPKKQHRGPVLAIVAAILVAGGLGGAAYMAYQAPNKVATQQPAQQQTEESPAQSIDKTTAEIDEGLKSIDDEQDFNSEALSDSSLGL